MLLFFLCTAAAVAEPLRLQFTNVAVEKPVHKRGELGLPIANDQMHQRYLVNVTVGTPPQHFSLTVDTGSTDLWVPIVNSSGCQPNCPPTFVPQDSSTLRDTGYAFNASYGLTPDLQILGEYYNDTVTIGNAVIPNMTVSCNTPDAPLLAVANVPSYFYDDGIFGLLGLGSRYSEAIAINPPPSVPPNETVTFPTLYEMLQLHGYTSRNLFSLWLNDQSASTGTLLFGGIDHTKYHGKLHSVPLLTSGPDHLFTGWAINLTSLEHVNGTSGKTKSLTAPTEVVSVILDSGSPNLYLPMNISTPFAKQLGASEVNGTAYVDCQLRQSTKDQRLDFALGWNGANISVPYPELIYPFGFPANMGKITAPDGTRLCYLGLLGSPGPIYLLGDPFIRSTYMVYDVDNLEVSMAQVAHSHQY